MEDSSQEFLTPRTFNSIFGEIRTEYDTLIKSENEYLFQESNQIEIGNVHEAIVLQNMADSTHCQSIQEPLSTGLMPSTDDYPGIYEFQIDFTKLIADKRKWQYSNELNKLFVSMNCEIPVKFSWIKNELGLYIRALPVYVSPDDFGEVIQRCPTHVNPMEKSNEGFLHVEHIIRCSHPGTIYDKNATSQRLSVLVPLDGLPERNGVSSIIYTFMCKNSCILGMNRRSTAIIFTLERINGEVIGRKFVNIRICSCPRRDLLKEVQLHSKRAEEIKQEAEDGCPPCKKPFHEKEKCLTKKLVLPQEMINFQIRMSKCHAKHFAKVMKEMILLSENFGELTAEEKITIQDCNKYLSWIREAVMGPFISITRLLS